MPNGNIVREVIDDLKLVVEAIETTKKIYEAVKSGKEYISVKHPIVMNDLNALLLELNKSMLMIKRSSSIINRFRFVYSIDASMGELRNFNNHYMMAQNEFQLLQNHIEDLRTHCSKVREHSYNIDKKANTGGIKKIFSIFGLHSIKREIELGERLDKLAYEDFEVANSAGIMLESLKKALDDIQNSLGTNGFMYSKNIPLAAEKLSLYSPYFLEVEKKTDETIRIIRDLAKDIKK